MRRKIVDVKRQLQDYKNKEIRTSGVSNTLSYSRVSNSVPSKVVSISDIKAFFESDSSLVKAFHSDIKMGVQFINYIVSTFYCKNHVYQSRIEELFLSAKYDYQVYEGLRVMKYMNIAPVVSRLNFDGKHLDTKMTHIARGAVNMRINSVLDIGTENVNTLNKLSDIFKIARVYGINVDKGFCHYANEDFELLKVEDRFKIYDGSVIPMDDKSIDYSILTSVLHHIDEDKILSFIDEVCRVTKKLVFVKDYDLSTVEREAYFSAQHHLFEGVLNKGNFENLKPYLKYASIVSMMHDRGFQVKGVVCKNNFNGTFFVTFIRDDDSIVKKNIQIGSKKINLTIDNYSLGSTDSEATFNLCTLKPISFNYDEKTFSPKSGQLKLAVTFIEFLCYIESVGQKNVPIIYGGIGFMTGNLLTPYIIEEANKRGFVIYGFDPELDENCKGYNKTMFKLPLNLETIEKMNLRGNYFSDIRRDYNSLDNDEHDNIVKGDITNDIDIVIALRSKFAMLKFIQYYTRDYIEHLDGFFIPQLHTSELRMIVRSLNIVRYDCRLIDSLMMDTKSMLCGQINHINIVDYLLNRVKGFLKGKKVNNLTIPCMLTDRFEEAWIPRKISLTQLEMLSLDDKYYKERDYCVDLCMTVVGKHCNSIFEPGCIYKSKYKDSMSDVGIKVYIDCYNYDRKGTFIMIYPVSVTPKNYLNDQLPNYYSIFSAGIDYMTLNDIERIAEEELLYVVVESYCIFSNSESLINEIDELHLKSGLENFGKRNYSVAIIESVNTDTW